MNLKIYNRECDEMTDISGIFLISSSTNPQWISLCGHLEAVIGNYFLSQAGNPEAYWYADDRVAFVLNSCLERVINDTVDYDVHYVGVDSLDEECIECRRYSDYCEHILPALWIDDDFLNDEKCCDIT